MDAFRRELDAAIAEGLESSEDEDDLENAVFLEAFEELIELSNPPVEKAKWGGSKPGRRYVYRDRELCHDRLVKDYFSATPTFDDVAFRRRFRMRRELFLGVVRRVCSFDSWFAQKRDAIGRLGLSALQKCTAAMRMLAYGIPADATDEYCRTGESTAAESLKRFTVAIRGCFEAEFLKQPTRADLDRQIVINTARGFPGMFGSIDCMHWTWKNCPVAWQGQFQDKDKDRSIILEAVADQSLWIWHACFGMPGGNNDINVLDRSPFITNLLKGDSSGMQFQINGHTYNRYYLLADGIYPQWSCFVQPIHAPQGEKKEHFTKLQSALRKDVERAFGVLQARFEIVKNPCKQRDLESITNVMFCCIILHNMVVQDEQHGQFESIFVQPM
jgi:hypothetical protein